MRLSNVARSRAFFSVALASLAGCSLQNGATATVGNYQMAAPAANDAARRAVKSDVSAIAVSDALNDVVNVYDPSGKQVLQLTNFKHPQGLASDIAGDLYVADTDNSRVAVYAAGLTGTPTTLDDPGQYPVGVDSFNNGAVVAAASYGPVAGGSGNVTFFIGGKRANTIGSSSLTHAYFCAFDATGNLYVDGLGPTGKTVVGEIVGGAQGTTFTTLTVSNSISFPGGMQVTTNGRIAIGDQRGLKIFTYAPPQNGSLGAPLTTTKLTGAKEPVTFAFTHDMTTLYAADDRSAFAEDYAYPAGGAPGATFKVGGQPVGIAVLRTQWPKKQ